jgi:hypothetical protein
MQEACSTHSVNEKREQILAGKLQRMSVQADATVGGTMYYPNAFVTLGVRLQAGLGSSDVITMMKECYINAGIMTD